MTNLQIVQQMYEAFRERDAQTLRTLFHPDIEWVQNAGFPGGGRHLGVEAVLKDVFAKFRVEWESWQAVVDRWLDAGDAVVALGEYRGRAKATGRDMTAAFAHVYWVREGQIIRFEQYTDTLEIARALQTAG